jgi:hypothetical protein
MQGLAARGQDLERRACREELLGEIRAGRDHVLAVVEDEEKRFAADELQESVDDRTSGLFLHAEDERHDLGHALLIGDRRELHQPGAIAVVAGQFRADLQRQARLSGAAATIRVTRRAFASACFTSAISRSLPTKLLSCAGRLCRKPGSAHDGPGSSVPSTGRVKR